MDSTLQKKPKSKVIEHGYISIYSELNKAEKRQIFFKRLYKTKHPNWDDSLVHLSKVLEKFVTGNERLLDIGCGNGNYLIDENRKKIKWAVGIDAEESATVKNQCLDKIVFGNSETLPFKDNSFDLVTSLWVLEHLSNPAAVFSEIYRVLKKKGVFLFVTPNSNYLPLKIIDFIRSAKFNYLLNSVLFGRKEKDIFKTYYRSNTIRDLKDLAKGKFEEIELRLNYDPSYTSFTMFTYRLTELLYKVFGKTGYLSPHIIGVFRKR